MQQRVLLLQILLILHERGKGSPMLGFEKQVGIKPTLMPKE